MSRAHSTAAGSLTGTGTLVRLALRRDRIVLPIWIAAFFVIAASSAASVADLYATRRSREAFAAGAGGDPATVALYGPASDLDTVGGIATWKLGVFGALVVGLLALFTVARHTRANEEAGRLELLSAGVLGRRAPLTAAVLVALGASTAVGLLTGLGLAAGGTALGASLGFGLALATAGWVFTGVAAITAQLTESSRGANSLAAALLAALYLLRAVGDAAGSDAVSWLSWGSPLEWPARLRAYSDAPHWWVLVLPVAGTVVLLAVGYVLVARRDIGAGLLPDRPGPAAGGATMAGPFGLAWRLQRGLLIGWSVGFVVFGGALGAIASGISGLTGGSRQVTDMLERLGGVSGLIDAYLATCMSLMGILAAAYAVQATLRLRAEETGQRAEPVLATGVGRLRWAAAHLACTVFGSALLLALAGTAAGLGYGLRTGEVAHQLPRVLAATLVQFPAALVLAGLALALFGLLPRLTSLAWAAVLICLAFGMFGPLFHLDQRVLDISPFTHVPRLPGGETTVAPLLWLLAVALALGATGLLSLRRRDIG